MEIALQEARNAALKDEVPIGAVLVLNEKILAVAHNQTIGLSDPTAHAEILAMRAGAKKLFNYRLLNTTLYVTIEPCIMCMGAVINARVARVVYGANDLKWGACGSLYDFSNDTRLNHHVDVISGIYEDQSRAVIQDFFKQKRKNNL
ncbi:tRNA-specific adenosine deaminase [Candidatus Magnetomoraceae bacterium gMMP-15]